jgi:hypothetical protein
MMIRAAFALVLLLMQAPLFATCALAAPYEDPYDPQSCKTDAHGKLYIALGRNVLAFPTSRGVVVVEAQLYPGNNPIPPPDPTQPEGCPDNPRQLTSYAFPHASAIALTTDEKTSPNQTLGAQRIVLFRTLKGDATPTDSDPIWPSEDLELKLASSSCAQATIQEDLPNGLHACRVKPHFDDNHEVDQRSWGGSYTAASALYSTPTGRPFVAHCGPLLFDCRVAYVIAPGLGLVYEFQPYVGSRIIPVGKIIDFDKELRATVGAMLVPDFPW